MPRIRSIARSVERKRASCPGTGWIHLRNLEVKCVLGVYAEERTRRRRVVVNASLECDTRSAAATDRLEDALNYERIEAEILALAVEGRFQLVETLAERVAEACLRQKGVNRVRVVVDKPGALACTKSVAVEIERWK